MAQQTTLTFGADPDKETDPGTFFYFFLTARDILTANKLSVQYPSSTRQQTNIVCDELVTTVAHLAAKEPGIAPGTAVETKTRAKMRANIRVNSSAGQN